MSIRVEFPEELLVASWEEPQVLTRFSVIHYTAEELEEEARTSREIATREKGS